MIKNTAAKTIPTVYEMVIPCIPSRTRLKHSGAYIRYVTETADINVAGITAIQHRFLLG